MSESIGENAATSVIPMGPKLASVILEDALLDSGELLREIVEWIMGMELGTGVVQDAVLKSTNNSRHVSMRFTASADAMRESPGLVIGRLLEAAPQVARQIKHHRDEHQQVQVRIVVGSLEDLASSIGEFLDGWHPAICIEATVGEGAPARKEQSDVEETP
jgi:hypothetical protein